jgi:S1-C subfamily serine protease
MAPLAEPEPDPEPSREPAPATPEAATLPRPVPPVRDAPAPSMREPLHIPWRAVGIAAATAIVILALALGGEALLDSGSSRPGAAKAGWIGLKLGVLQPGRVVVTGVRPGSPAGAAGVRAGDVITEVQSRPVAAPIDVTLAVDALQAGETLELAGQHGSQPYTVRVRLAARDAKSGP